MDAPPKERPRGKLWALPEEQRTQLIEWVLSDLSYPQVAELMRKNFGVSTNRTALCEFRQRLLQDRLMERQQAEPPKATILEIVISVTDDNKLRVKVLR
jgi:hypothetical protein